MISKAENEIYLMEMSVLGLTILNCDFELGLKIWKCDVDLGLRIWKCDFELGWRISTFNNFNEIFELSHGEVKQTNNPIQIRVSEFEIAAPCMFGRTPLKSDFAKMSISEISPNKQNSFKIAKFHTKIQQNWSPHTRISQNLRNNS